MPPKPKLPACGFYVTVKATDQSVPIKIKKVAKGKRVCILSGITGNRTKAVDTLKQMLGVGGEVSVDVSDGIELQGDQTGRLTTILRNLGALRGEIETPSVSSGVVRGNYAYDKFMKSDTKPAKSAATDLPVLGEASQACILVHGKFWPYCNGDCSFCPPLTDVFEGLDMYCSWFEPESKKDPADPWSGEPMPTQELHEALSALGLKAETGAALRLYEKEKHMARTRVVVSEHAPVHRPTPPPRVRAKPVVKPTFVDKPVRVILNQRSEFEQDDDWFVAEVSLIDPSLWITDYQEFIISLLAETAVVVAHSELVDSKHLKILFADKASMDTCVQVLHEVMPSFFTISTKDRKTELPDVDAHGEDEGAEEDEGVWCEDMYGFQRMAEELGLESNETFWEMFTTFTELSDGSNEGMLDAFQKAVLEVTSEPPTEPDSDVVHPQSSSSQPHVYMDDDLDLNGLTDYDYLIGSIPPPPSRRH